ncbi:MAG: PAS domain S-box protein [Deltaproteobacteria bacterium]|nr:PAS domain S-box protein [Deltaproteobacteria bacterium]
MNAEHVNSEYLLKKEKVFRSIFENSTIGLAMVSPDGFFLHANNALSSMLGYSKEALLKKNCFHLIVNDDMEDAHACHKMMVDGGINLIQFEKKTLADDGSFLWLQISSIPVRDKAGNIEYYIIQIENITDQKAIEESLKDSESKWRDIAQNSPDHIVLLNKKLEVIYINRPMYELSTEKILGSRLLNYIPHEYHDGVVDSCMKTLKDGKTHTFESKYFVAGNDLGTFESRVGPLRKGGEIVSLVVSIRDVTERKEAEAELKKSEERCSLVIKGVSDGIWDRNLQTGEIYFSPRWKEMLGYKDDEIPDRYEEWEKRVHPDDYQYVVKDINDHFQGEAPFYMSEFRMRHKEGSYRWILARGATIKDGKGKPTRFAGSHTDITEKKYMEEELLKARRIESIGLLAGGIAHDFNNILTGVLTNIQVAKDCLDDFENYENDISTSLAYAEAATLRATELTKQLLTFSKGGAPTIKSASVADLITETASFVLRGSNVRRRCIIPENLWDARIDTGQISQVLNNLLINAKQSMPKGGTVSIKAENKFVDDDSPLPLERGNYIKITIKDRGTGILPENMDRIFDPYFTTKGEGNGLGLATSYMVVKKHKGHIFAESKAGAGTAFYVYLPASSEKASRKSSVKEKNAYQGTGRVLLLEDEQIVANSIKSVVVRAGYDLQHVEDGKDAIKIYKKAREIGEHFDVVMMDLTIAGGMGGVETLKRLKKIDPLVKAIVCSGYSEGDVISDYEKYGFCDVLPKPFSRNEVLEKLDKALKKAH